jgi:hypothetical protein
VKEKYQDFSKIFAACKSLKIMNINNLKAIIANKKESERIYSIKDKKLKNSYETYKLYKITDDLILSTMKRLLDADIITPHMNLVITTSTIAKYHPIIYLNYTSETFKIVEEIGRFFPRIYYEKSKDLATDKPLIRIFLFLINIKEKELFCSIIYSLFSKEIISFQRCFTNGITPYNKVMDFYNFDAREFFYSKDVFEQAFLYIQHALGDVRKSIPE